MRSENSRQDIADTVSTVDAIRPAPGTRNCFQAARMPVNKNGMVTDSAGRRYSSGAKYLTSRAIPTAKAMLTHHRERSRTANKEFSDILKRTEGLSL
jgi:hypothetical protein